MTVTAFLEPSVPAGHGQVLPATQPDQQLHVEVTDTGVGIRREDQDRIFLEFEQIDSSYNRKQQGTGLGLALTRRLVELHGGRIWVGSEGLEGQGSSFKFVIPLAGQSISSAGTTLDGAIEESMLRPLVVILAERSDRVLPLRYHLDSIGYEVAVVHEAEAVAELLGERRPFAVVVHHDEESEAGTRMVTTLLRICLPMRVPVVQGSAAGNQQWEFRSLAQDGLSELPPKPRLADVVRTTGPAHGKEVKTALIVEDDPCLRDLLARAVVARGFRVFQASNGQRGLDLVNRHHPDVVILDLVMPDLDGIQIVERLRANPRTNHIPILIHTGATLTEEERQRLASQVQAITSKTEPQRLLAHVDQLDSFADQTPVSKGI